jgi:hypothetical protein
VSRGRPFRDDFYVRLLSVDWQDRDGLACMIDGEIAACGERLAELIDRRDAIAGDTGQPMVRRLVAAAAVRQAETELESLRQCRAAVLGLRDVASKPSSEVVRSPQARTGSTRGTTDRP